MVCTEGKNKVRRKGRDIRGSFCAPALIAALAILLLLVPGCSKKKGNQANSIGSGSSTDANISIPMREAVTPDTGAEILEMLPDSPELKKVYSVRTNEWFLAEGLTDFSQAIEIGQISYVLNGETEYTVYRVNENGRVVQAGEATYSADYTPPHGLFGLTYAIIEEAIGSRSYDDYVIAQSSSLGTVFVWVRSGEGDFIITYPIRPEAVGLENGGVYSLSELAGAISAAVGA